MCAARGLSALAIAGWTMLGLVLQSCGAMSSGDCADKATCAESDGSIGEEISNLQVLDSALDSPEDGGGDIPSKDVATEDVAVADIAHEDAKGADVVNADVRNDAFGMADAPSADVAGNDVAIADVKSEAATSGDVVSEDVASDTGGGQDGGAACVPSSCASCVPYFVQCCKLDSTCGCSLLFPPGPCN
jgi:hypothetical protein